MPPKPTKRPSLFSVWAKHEAESKAREGKKRPFEKGEVVSLADSEDIDERVWPVFNPDLSQIGPQSPPKLEIKYTVLEVLEEKGYDAEAGETIIYPSGEVIRPYELSILKTCLSVNTSVCLPGSVCPIQIVVLTFLNFKRWFPTGCFIFCTSESPDIFKSSCIFNGIDEKDITICSTFNSFKQKKDGEIGPFIVCTQQTIQKIVDTDDPIMTRIRCIAVCMDQCEQSQKYAKFVGPIVGKGNLFRLLITTPSRPSKSRKIAPISTRQKTITSMFITEWEEPSATNGSFRRAVVPSGIRPLLWNHADLSPETVEFLTLWKEGAEQILCEFSSSITLPSKNIEDLLNIDYLELLKEAEAVSSELGEKCLICAFLTTAYRHLLLNGLRVFYLYCSDSLNNKSAGSRSEEIQICILGSPALSKAFEYIEVRYSYNNASPCNTTPSANSLNSHVKYQKLAKMVHDYIKTSSPIRGVILCETLQISRTVCESISHISNLKVILGVPPAVTIPPENEATTRPFNRLSGLFVEQKNTVVVMSIGSEDEAVFQALDTASANELHFIIAMGRKSLSMAEYHKKEYFVFLNETHELLRELDGRIVQEAEELSAKEVTNMVTGAVGSVNKYAFKFEQSNLAIDLRDKKIRFVQFGKGELLPPPVTKKAAKRILEEKDDAGEEAPNTVEKRKRGRPRKSAVSDPKATTSAEESTLARTIPAEKTPFVKPGRRLRSNSNQSPIVISSSSNNDTDVGNSAKENNVEMASIKSIEPVATEKRKRGRPLKKAPIVEEIKTVSSPRRMENAEIIQEDASPVEPDILSDASMNSPAALERFRKFDEATEKLDRILMIKTPQRLM